MANTKISQLTANTNPNGNEELVYAYNNTNGKMTLNTMKTFSTSWCQPTLVSWTNIKTINNESILWSWNLVIQWWWGWAIENAFDAVVDAWWGWDYTTVWAAITAGKYSIFIKNWSYTESIWRDPYTNNASFLRIVWESKAWVQITMPSTMTTTNGYMIDMRYTNNGANFYMENITFNITLTSSNTKFYFDRGGNSIIKNCSFTYDTNVSWASSWMLELIRTGVKWTVLYNCDFTSLSSEYIWIWHANLNAYGCTFKSTAWLIQLIDPDYDWVVKLDNCVIDTKSFWWIKHIKLYYCNITVDWWVISDSYPIIDCMYWTKFITSNLSTYPTWYTVDDNDETSIIDWSIISIQSTLDILHANVSNSILTAPRFDVKNVSWCILTWNIHQTRDGSCFVWNKVVWSSFALTWDWCIVVWNAMPWVTITDTWTWNVKANNISS